MPGSSLPNEVCEMIADNLLIYDLLKFSTSCRQIHAISIKVIDAYLAAELIGLDGICFPRMQCCRESNYRICLSAALQPYYVLSSDGQVEFWPGTTMPFRFSLDSRGPVSLEFQITAAKKIHGVPKIGFIDADAAVAKTQHLPDGWRGDFSRGVGVPDDLFAVAFNPACGTLHASKEAIKGLIRNQPATGSTFLDRCRDEDEVSAKSPCEYFGAKLNWDELGDDSEEWNDPIEAAITLEDGNLTFYRRWGDEECHQWHSSGIILSSLPRKVLPCVFLSSYVGSLEVKFLRMSVSSPPICAGCDHEGHGLVTGWKRIVH